MNPQSGDAVGDATETAPEKGAVEQISFEDQLIALAKEEGRIEPTKAEAQPVEEPPETAEDQPEVEETDETETPETPVEGEDLEQEEEEKEEEPKPAAKREDWPESAKARVAEETEKKRRANDRAVRAEAELDKARGELEETRRQLSQASGPMPTPDNPLIDIQEPLVLDRLERVYELLEEVDIENVDEEGMVTVPASIGRDGKIIYQKIEPEQARLAQKRADRVLRKDIPNRRKYLTERAQVDARVIELYPDLKNPDHEFTKIVTDLTRKVLSGEAMTSPEVKFWASNAVYGLIKRQEEAQASNGKGASSVKKIVDSTKQKLAPTAPRTRATVERKTSADLAKVQKRFEENPDDSEAREAYVASLLSQKDRQKKVQPVAE